MFEQGRPLSPQERITFKPYFAQIVIEQARIIDSRVPFWLRSVLHCAFHQQRHPGSPARQASGRAVRAAGCAVAVQAVWPARAASCVQLAAAVA